LSLFSAPLIHLITYLYIDLIVFVSLDFVALTVQAVGGRKASIAAQDGQDPEPGGKIMMYGVIVQMIGMTLVYPLALKELSLVNSHPSQFCILGTDFLFRFYWNKPLPSALSNTHANRDTTLPATISLRQPIASSRFIPIKTRLMLVGVGITTIWVFIRCIYRIVELANGWTSRITTTQAYFIVLDGTPILLAMFTLNVFHPGWLLREENRSYPDKLDKMSGSHSTSDTSREEYILEIARSKEEYILEIARPKEDYILPLPLDLGCTLDLWKLGTSINHEDPLGGRQR
jgi:hypothetical protein